MMALRKLSYINLLHLARHIRMFVSEAVLSLSSPFYVQRGNVGGSVSVLDCLGHLISLFGRSNHIMFITNMEIWPFHQRRLDIAKDVT